MPYRSIDELPKAQTKRYTEHQKSVFRKAFNAAVYQQNVPESRAFAIAHAAAKRAKRGSA